MRSIKGQDEGITPIIGTLLLVVLMLTMISLILIIGAPTLNNIQTSTQYMSTEGYLMRAARDMRGLVRMGEGASVEPYVYIPTGRLAVEEDSEVWAISFDHPDSEYDVRFTGLTDTNRNSFTVNDPSGGAISPLISVTRLDTTPHSSLGVFHGWGRWTIALGGVCQITVEDPSGKLPFLARAYVFELGEIEFDLPSPSGTYRLEVLNAHTVSDYPGQPDVKDTPFMSSASSSPTDRSLVLHFADLTSTGITSAGPGDYTLNCRYTMELPLVGLEVKDLRLFVGGEFSTAFYDTFSESLRHYHGDTGEMVGFVPGDGNDECVIYHVADSTKADGTGTVRLDCIYSMFDVEVAA